MIDDEDTAAAGSPPFRSAKNADRSVPKPSKSNSEQDACSDFDQPESSPLSLRTNSSSIAKLNPLEGAAAILLSLNVPQPRVVEDEFQPESFRDETCRKPEDSFPELESSSSYRKYGIPCKFERRVDRDSSLESRGMGVSSGGFNREGSQQASGPGREFRSKDEAAELSHGHRRMMSSNHGRRGRTHSVIKREIGDFSIRFDPSHPSSSRRSPPSPMETTAFNDEGKEEEEGAASGSNACLGNMEKPYAVKCSMCHVTFPSDSALYGHMRHCKIVRRDVQRKAGAAGAGRRLIVSPGRSRQISQYAEIKGVARGGKSSSPGPSSSNFYSNAISDAESPSSNGRKLRTRGRGRKDFKNVTFTFEDAVVCERKIRGGRDGGGIRSPEKQHSKSDYLENSPGEKRRVGSFRTFEKIAARSAVTYGCRHCGKVFMSKYALSGHYRHCMRRKALPSFRQTEVRFMAGDIPKDEMVSSSMSGQCSRNATASSKRKIMMSGRFPSTEATDICSLREPMQLQNRYPIVQRLGFTDFSHCVIHRNRFLVLRACRGPSGEPPVRHVPYRIAKAMGGLEELEESDKGMDDEDKQGKQSKSRNTYSEKLIEKSDNQTGQSPETSNDASSRSVHVMGYKLSGFRNASSARWRCQHWTETVKEEEIFGVVERLPKEGEVLALGPF